MMVRPMAFGVFSSAPQLRACATAASSEVTVRNICQRTVDLEWGAIAARGPFRVWYRPSDSSVRSLRTTVEPRVQLRNLRPGLSYDVEVVPGVGHANFTTTACAEGAAATAEGSDQGAELPMTELSRLEVRVGKIIECEPHPDADTLYVEKVDCGEAEPRTIVSGLVKFVSQEELVGRTVVVLCNLKPRAMRGVTSHGMLLCASNEDHTKVDPLSAPESAAIGELVTFEGHKSAPLDPGNRASKAFDRVAADLKTSADGVAMHQDVAFMTSSGPCFSPAKLEGSVS